MHSYKYIFKRGLSSLCFQAPSVISLTFCPVLKYVQLLLVASLKTLTYAVSHSCRVLQFAAADCRDGFQCQFNSSL